ncbi:pyridoxamine 5'-phosphate oxidase family protein [Herbiconiux sp. P15]|uniref:pyridoxamine 5'-phosphate oxidase family protein n=1 Tax=Herbiconiux liukaitaii TaxID=3342799 RepID=UPI0035BAADFF
MSTHDEDIKVIATLIESSKTALVTSRTADGALHSRPLQVQEAEFDGDLWFFTQHPSEKTDEIAAHPQVNAAFESSKGYLSIAGSASVVTDAAKIDELWNKGIEAWFPGGREDPTVALLKIEAESAEYWATDEPRAVQLFKIARAAATGGTPDIGENKSVEL